jgi:PAS domain S-box-containing protein
MAKVAEFSRTVRIDLIPETPKEPIANKRRIVVASSSRSGSISMPSVPVEPVAGQAGRYLALLESIYDAVLITDLGGKVVDANTRASDFLLFPKGELIGLSIADVISGAEASLLRDLLGNLEQQRFVLIQAYCERKNGTQFPSEIAVARIRTHEDQLGFFLRDITVRRQAEEMLRVEHNAIQSAANGIAIANLDGLLEYVNPAFSAMLESQSQSDLVGVNIRELFDVAIAEELIGTVLGQAGSWAGEVAAELPSGKSLHLQVLANCNRNSDGEKVGFVFSFTDLSDRKRAEAAQREIERNRVMLESLGAACHHLGQPATLLMGNLSLLQVKMKDADPFVRELLSSSMDAIDRLGKTLHKLNQVNEYRTRLYVEHTGNRSGETTNILDI